MLLEKTLGFSFKQRDAAVKQWALGGTGRHWEVVDWLTSFSSIIITCWYQIANKVPSRTVCLYWCKLQLQSMCVKVVCVCVCVVVKLTIGTTEMGKRKHTTVDQTTWPPDDLKLLKHNTRRKPKVRWQTTMAISTPNNTTQQAAVHPH